MSPAAAIPTILIADDEPLVISALARLARRMGMHFISDSTSEHVVDMAKTHKPDVIILDVRQNIDGRDLLARLKSDPETIIKKGANWQFFNELKRELKA